MRLVNVLIVNVIFYTCGSSDRTPVWTRGELTSYIHKKSPKHQQIQTWRKVTLVKRKILQHLRGFQVSNTSWWNILWYNPTSYTHHFVSSSHVERLMSQFTAKKIRTYNSLTRIDFFKFKNISNFKKCKYYTNVFFSIIVLIFLNVQCNFLGKGCAVSYVSKQIWGL